MGMNIISEHMTMSIDIVTNNTLSIPRTPRVVRLGDSRGDASTAGTTPLLASSATAAAAPRQQRPWRR